MSKALSLVVAAILTLGIAAPVSALSPEQKRLYQSGVYQFDIEVSADNNSCEGGIRLSGNSNEAKAFNFFTDEERGESKLTPDQAAGIVGNLIAESGVMPKRKQGSGVQLIQSINEVTPGTGYGIAQWTTADRQAAWKRLAREKSMDPLSLDLQLLYLLHELETNAGFGLSHLKQAQDVRQAAWVFLVFFERPAATSGHEEDPNQPEAGTSAFAELETRETNADRVLNGDNSPTNDSSGCGGFGTALDGNESEPDFNKDYNVRYDGPPADNQCTGGFTPGAESLKEIILDAYSPPVSSIGGYSCRDNTADPGSVSIHGVGRALDIMVDSTTPEGKETGDRIRNLLINNAENIGIQLVIWDRHTWSVNHQGWRPYTGPNPHTDHLHVEINIAASNNPQLGK